MADWQRRATYVDPRSRCGHAAQLAEALGLPAEGLPRRHSRQYWDDLLDKVRALAEPDR